MKTLRRIVILLLLLLLLPLIAFAAHWRGYYDGVRAQTFADDGRNLDAGQLDTMLREIAANHWQGYADDVTMWDVRALDAAFSQRKLSAHCLTISNYAVWRLRQAGYQARNVGLMNVHPDDWNGTGDAHAVLEVWHPAYAQWVVVDMLFNRMYVQTAVAFIQARTTPIMLADDPYSNPADFTEQLPDPETDVYPRVAQFLSIEGGDNGIYWHGNAAAQAVVAEFARRYGGTPAPYRPDFLVWAYGA